MSKIKLSCYTTSKESIELCNGSVVIKDNNTEIIIEDEKVFKKIQHVLKEEVCSECKIKMMKYYSQHGKTLFQCPTCNKFYEEG